MFLLIFRTKSILILNFVILSSNRGTFDSFFERMVKLDYGSFRWEIANSCSNRAQEQWKLYIILKGLIILILFGNITLFYFMIGLVTFGVLW